ncbi:hypothetical protein JY97_07805 [Alkalispirochaeta odontotermitis]|nr:hypothetical protein JY97_07805 [Alkalispirochaeta odontotermitis]CAB1071478.1 hypothetical protein D1AOALGA4SA_1256 [Olavius algarvensis Delta 1 endosymbiont]
MINAIGEAAMQHSVRTSYNAEMLGKNQEVKKIEKIKEPRPIEKSDDGQKSEMESRSKDNLTTRNSFVDGQLVVEKYDENGKLVKKTPPGYLPLGEVA